MPWPLVEELPLPYIYLFIVNPMFVEPFFQNLFSFYVETIYLCNIHIEIKNPCFNSILTNEKLDEEVNGEHKRFPRQIMVQNLPVQLQPGVVPRLVHHRQTKIFFLLQRCTFTFVVPQLPNS